MSLKHAILGLLRSQPMSGYELKTQQFDRGVAHFWTADQAQIYRTLDHLREQGLVEAELVVQQDRPNKKIYRLTAEGEAELVRWLATKQEEPPLREPFLVQVFFGDALEKTQLLQVLRDKLEERRQVLAALKAIEVPELAEPSLIITLRGSTRDLGVAYEHVAIRWLEDLIRRVEGLPTRAWRKPPPSGARRAR